MNKFMDVDETKCVKCGVCAEICPMKLIAFKPGKAPRAVMWAPKVCISCGHCASSCPKGALSLAAMPLEKFTSIKGENKITSAQIEQFMRSRRSIRTYKDQPVEKNTLKELVMLARYAPTGHNSQSVRWQVIYEKEDVDKLKNVVIEWMKRSVEAKAPIAEALGMENILAGWASGLDFILRGAPHVVVTYASKDDRLAPLSATIALAHFELGSRAFGLGACWAGFLDLAIAYYPPAKELLGLPEGYVSLGSMMFGHPEYEYHRIPPRKEPVITWK